MSEKNKEKYDKELAKAYKDGKVNEEVKPITGDFLSELANTLAVGDCGSVVRKCTEALNNNVKDVAKNNLDNCIKVIFPFKKFSK